jgi:hypothetical protein
LVIETKIAFRFAWVNSSAVNPTLSANQRPVSSELLDLRRLAVAILLRSLQDLIIPELEQEKSYKWFFTEAHEPDFRMWCLLAGVSPTRARQKAEELMKTGQARPKGLCQRGQTWDLTVYRGRKRYRVNFGRGLSREQPEALARQKREELQRLFQTSVQNGVNELQQEPDHKSDGHKTTSANESESPKEIIPLGLIEGQPAILA